MATEARAVLDHYNIRSNFPDEWPAEKDLSDVSDGETVAKPKVESKAKTRAEKTKSRYGALERNAHDRRSLVPGSQVTRDGVENLVQKDEADPLRLARGTVVQTLMEHGLPVDDDQLLRNRFLLSSTTFNPSLYLSKVHLDASGDDLIRGLRNLSASIDEKSASLKVLVESNFERFVRAKSTIDSVYTEMRNQGSEPELDKGRNSRHASRSSGHFRSPSGQVLGAGVKIAMTDKKRQALLKESEYGVLGIKTPLLEVAVKVDEVWGPALGGRDRENSLKTILDSVDKSRDILGIGVDISELIKHKDYAELVREYGKAKNYVENARITAGNATRSSRQLTDPEIHQIIMTARMWQDVQRQIQAFQRGVWRDLTSHQANLTMSADGSHEEDHIALISVLLELGVDDNPIWIWLLSRYEYLKEKINTTFDRSRAEIEALRRHLATEEKPTLHATATHFRSPKLLATSGQHRHLDSASIIDTWDSITLAISNLLSLKGGILGEVLNFWERAQSFMDGKAQKNLPDGIDGSSRKHHRLSSDGVVVLQKGVVELIELLRSKLYAFVADSPMEDIGKVLSPPSNGPLMTSHLSTLSPFSQSNHRLSQALINPPPAAPKKGEPWEEFAFWPPFANSLSGVHYLGKMIALLGTAANEMASVRPSAAAGSPGERMKSLLNSARERFTRAVLTAWSADARAYKLLEDWTRDPENRDVTRLPASFAAFEGFVLSGIQRILYMPGAAVTRRGAMDIVTPPSTKLVGMVRAQFASSIYAMLSGMVENTEKPFNLSQDPWTADKDSLVVDTVEATNPKRNAEAIDTSNRNLRRLFTFSNLKALQTMTVPQLISQFEADFSVKLTEESSDIYDTLSNYDNKLFNSYTRPIIEKLSSIIQAGISSPSWVPGTNRPTEVRPYVDETLLQLVYVHMEVSTTSPPLTSPIISHLLDQVSKALLEAFKQRPKYSLPALMQATLDVEFIAQTLSYYSTEQASGLQSEIYQVIDQRTDGNARARLQNELPEMRAILKKLREGTRSEFACFKRPRTGK